MKKTYDVQCSRCGTQLDFIEGTDIEGDSLIEAAPCPVCLEQARTTGDLMLDAKIALEKLEEAMHRKDDAGAQVVHRYGDDKSLEKRPW